MRDANENLNSLVNFMKYGKVVQKGSPFQVGTLEKLR